MSEWISVEDRLPEEYKAVVFGWFKNGMKLRTPLTGWYEGEGDFWQTETGPFNDNPTHWQSLPEPPKE